MFRGPIATARAVARCGFFCVELCNDEDTYCMRFHGEMVYVVENGKARGKVERVRSLRLAATAWVERFGELKPEIQEAP
jgi:hypothetical protein